MILATFRHRGKEDSFDNMAEIDAFVDADFNFNSKTEKEVLFNNPNLFSYFICLCKSYGRIVKVKVCDPDTYLARTAMIDDENFILSPFIL